VKLIEKTVILEHVSCDFCGCNEYYIRYRKPDTWLWINQFEYPVVECNVCSLVYINPRPTQNSMADFYANEYHNNRDTEEFIKKYEFESSYLPELSNENVLDIGCAKGDFLIFMKKKYSGISIYGIDYYSETVNSDEINFKQKLLYESGYSDEFFDIITAWAVFEHLHTPSLYFREISRILKKGGKFIFLVTNSESLYGKRAFIEDIPRHLYHYSEKSLKNYAEKFGFSMKVHYDDRIWDGRGSGTFHYTLSSLFGVTWEKRYFNQLNLFHIFAGKLGTFLDSIVFRTHWEAKKRCSGVIIVEFIKN
jgi:ubiquinone/menaquinone biosynthesis C-methylase UbiE